ncbi:FtsW/RodA/SpoVE family cell cycle protein [Metabacillus fastidiosus]|uniref:FtsW/RodA/SpoVE family cell cycle protein n=1 Tax=Metabacillus fastidiosus TaxID=1458 RepID=UPI002E22CC47|nr:FtsW/RodA/SpoVE family cell cycle protein [Metabacillus fastidiosus]MED4533738.1 FtsW/RodA/SpoVE family cell cycle protein [Metabacillus fastidiosus]
MENKKDSFLNEVIKQIRVKEARESVSIELNHHINEIKEKWIKKGLSEADAENKAVKQMGDPIKLGQQLYKIYRPKIDWLMIILLILTLLISFLPLLSLNSFDYTNGEYLMKRKIIFILFGAIAALGVMFIDYRKYKKLGWGFYIAGMALLAAIFILRGAIINGQIYLAIGSLKIDSTFAVPFLFLGFSSFLSNSKMKTWLTAILFFFSLLFIYSLANNSTTFLYAIMIFMMFWHSKLRNRNIFIIITVMISLAGGIALFISQLLQGYQKERILGFLHPEEHAGESGYLYLLIKRMIGEGGYFGKPEVKELLPQAHTELIFVNLIHYYGWIVALIVIFILSLFILRVILISNKINDTYGKLLITGAITFYTVQFIYSTAMNLGFLPIIGMSLPFMSYGLMPVLLNSIIIGVILSVYRRKDLITVH